MYYLKLIYGQCLKCLKWEIGNMFTASKEQSLHFSVFSNNLIMYYEGSVFVMQNLLNELS